MIKYVTMYEFSPLLILTDEMLDSRSMNARDEARLDISARGLGTKYQMGFFDVRVLETNAKKWRKNR